MRLSFSMPNLGIVLSIESHGRFNYMAKLAIQ